MTDLPRPPSGSRPGTHGSVTIWSSRTGLEASSRWQNLLQREFYPLLDRAGLPPIRFHDPRHTAATLMQAQGVHQRIAADLLGHASPSLILDRHGHAIEAMHRQAAQAMDTHRRPGRPPPPPPDARGKARPSVGVAATLAAKGGLYQRNPCPRQESNLRLAV